MTMTHSAVGKSAKRLDGPEKVTGQLQYTGDLRLPGMLHARLVVSPYAHARIVRIVATAALEVPGVVRVMTGADLPIAHPESSRKGEPIAREEVVFNGQPVAVVLAESEAAAEDGVALVDVAYELLPAVMDPEQAMAPGAHLVRLHKVGALDEASLHASVGGNAEEASEPLPPNVSNRVHFHRGNVEQGFSEADVLIEGRYRTQWAHQSYLEPQSAIAAMDPLGNLTIWCSTQGVFHTREEMAKLLGFEAHKIKIVPMPVGGGFGGKVTLVEPIVASIAMVVGRPVRLVFTRVEEFYAANPASQAILDVKIGAKSDGTMTSLRARVLYDTGAFPGSPLGICCVLFGAYNWQNLDVLGLEVMTNRVSPGSYRAPGAPQTFFSLESTVDDLARRLGQDPLELRLKNAVVEGDLQANGSRYPRIGLRQCLDRLKEHPAWQQRDQKGPDEGVGIAIGGWPGGLQSASAACRLDHDGTLTITSAAVDLSGTNTTFALIAAEVFDMPVEKIRVVTGDSDSAPFTGLTGGSKITYTVGPAVRKAAEEAKRQVLTIAADRLEVSVDDLELVDGNVQVKGVPSRSLSLSQIAALTVRNYEPVYGRGASAIRSGSPGFTVHLARVKVDRSTGKITVLEYIPIQDVGFAINPAEVAGQITGGVTQGLGWALYERILYDDEGNLLTGSLLDYAVPTALDVPPISPVFVEVPSVDGPFGAKGVGEPPVIPVPATVANAVRDAVGIRLNEIPMTSEAVLKALWKAMA